MLLLVPTRFVVSLLLSLLINLSITNSFVHFILSMSSLGGGQVSSASASSSVAASNELRFVPADPAHLDAMYQAMCQCQLLHPDPDDSVEEEGDNDDGGFIFAVGEGVAPGNGGDQEEPMEHEEEGQFDDAD